MAKLQVKFDIAHFIATEKLAVSKYPALCALEARHGVNVGSEYNNERLFVAKKTIYKASKNMIIEKTIMLTHSCKDSFKSSYFCLLLKAVLAHKPLVGLPVYHQLKP